MNKEFIKNVYLNIRNNYDFDLLSYTPLTSKSIKILTKNNDKYIIKKSKNKVKSKYSFLKNEGLDNIIYPKFNKNNNYLTRLANNNCVDDECYYVSPYYEDNNVLNEKKAKNLLEELKVLHEKTSFTRNLSMNKSKSKMEEIIIFFDYKFKSLEAYIRTIEAQNYDEFSIPVLKNYHHILDCKSILIEKNRKIVNKIKEEKAVTFCFLHNNPKIDHLIINNGNKYLISIDNGVIGIPSLDIAKFYIENNDINFDMYTHIKEYFNAYNDDFYFDYFVFLVMFIYLKGLIIDVKGYISTQSFIYTTNSLNNFIKLFKLKETQKWVSFCFFKNTM